MAKYRNENKWDAEIDRAAAANGVPVWVLKSTIAAESAFDPTAYNPETGSRWGPSRGLMQFIEATARRMGLQGDVGDDATRRGGLYEPQIAIALGGKYLGSLRERYPTEPWDAIYAAYNAGSIFRPASGVGFNNQAQVDNWTRRADYFNPDWRSGRGDPSQGSSGPALDPQPSTPVSGGPSSPSSPAPCTSSTGTADGFTATEDHDMTELEQQGRWRESVSHRLGEMGQQVHDLACQLVTILAALESKGISIDRVGGFGEGIPAVGFDPFDVAVEAAVANGYQLSQAATDGPGGTAAGSEAPHRAVDSGESAESGQENAAGESARASSDDPGESPAGPGDAGDCGDAGDVGAA